MQFKQWHDHISYICSWSSEALAWEHVLPTYPPKNGFVQLPLLEAVSFQSLWQLNKHVLHLNKSTWKLIPLSLSSKIKKLKTNCFVTVFKFCGICLNVEDRRIIAFTSLLSSWGELLPLPSSPLPSHYHCILCLSIHLSTLAIHFYPMSPTKLFH